MPECRVVDALGEALTRRQTVRRPPAVLDGLSEQLARTLAVHMQLGADLLKG
jgi:hypothetical protein